MSSKMLDRKFITAGANALVRLQWNTIAFQGYHRLIGGSHWFEFIPLMLTQDTYGLQDAQY